MHFLYDLAVYAIPLIFAITMHEAAHGWMAERFGDDTASMMGRVTLNPIPHIDLVRLSCRGFCCWVRPSPV